MSTDQGRGPTEPASGTERVPARSRRRGGGGCGVPALVLVVLGLLGLGLLVHGLHDSGDPDGPSPEEARRQAIEDVRANLPGAREAAERGQATVLRVLDRRLDGDTGPDHRWSELSCGFTSNGVVFEGDRYRQDCTVRAVALVPVPRRPAGQADGCRSLVSGRDTGSASSSADRGARSTVEDAEPASACSVALLDAEAPLDTTLVLLSGARPPSLGSSPEWVYVRTWVSLPSTDMGCQAGLFTCDPPFDRPVLPEELGDGSTR